MATKTLIEPRGRALRLSHSEIASIATIQADDVREAKRLFKRRMAQRWRGLVDAKLTK